LERVSIGGSKGYIEKARRTLQKMSMAERSRPKQLANPPVPLLPENFFEMKWNLLDIDDLELARQLTLVDWEYFDKIRAIEMLDQHWAKAKYRNLSPNLLKMIWFFNKVSAWVVHEILSREFVRDRARVMQKFIRVGEHLVGLNNFNSLMAILGGLNSNACSRLKFTFAELPPQIQKIEHDLEDLMSSDGNFKVFRARYKECLQKGPAIPYIGVFLTDLTFIDENKDTIDGLINFSKRIKVYETISYVVEHSKTGYQIQPVRQIQSLFKKLPAMDEQYAYSLSLRREPRGAERADIK